MACWARLSRLVLGLNRNAVPRQDDLLAHIISYQHFVFILQYTLGLSECAGVRSWCAGETLLICVFLVSELLRFKTERTLLTL